MSPLRTPAAAAFITLLVGTNALAQTTTGGAPWESPPDAGAPSTPAAAQPQPQPQPQQPQPQPPAQPETAPEQTAPQPAQPQPPANATPTNEAPVTTPAPTLRLPGDGVGGVDVLRLQTTAESPLASRRSALWAARLRMLNSSLPPIASRSRQGRLTDGITSLVIGAGTGVLGFFAPSTPTDTRPWFWAFGGVSLATGIVTLAWAPARENLTRQFELMPMDTARQRRARVRFGERALNDMAADGARRRTLGALAGAGIAIGMLGVAYRDPIFNGVPYTFSAYDAVIIGLTGLQMVTSLMQLFSRSEEERLRDTYFQQVQVLRGELQVGPR